MCRPGTIEILVPEYIEVGCINKEWTISLVNQGKIMVHLWIIFGSLGDCFLWEVFPKFLKKPKCFWATLLHEYI
jgi:hypothetical protein